MNKNDNSFESEGCSGCEEDEIVAKERNVAKSIIYNEYHNRK